MATRWTQAQQDMSEEFWPDELELTAEQSDWFKRKEQWR